MTEEMRNILNNDPVLSEIVKRLVAEFNPVRVFLFGSRTRGVVAPGTDYDILMVVASAKEPTHKLIQRAHRSVLRGIPAPIDVVVFDVRRFEERKTVIGSLPETVINEGKELYAAAA